MQVLITGSQGQLGRQLSGNVPALYEVTAVDLGEIDIRNRSSVWSVFNRVRPQLLINAAAYTAVDRAESESEEAFRVNSEGAANLATAALEFDARMIHISTDFVFDGALGRPYRPEDPPHPLGVYGRSKLEGEHRVLEILGRRACVVRTSWLYSVYGSNFVKTMLQLMKERPELSVVSDQVGTPTWAGTLAAFLWGIASLDELDPVLHWSDEGVASWYDFAVAIRDEGLALKLLESSLEILPVSSSDYPTAAFRPQFSVLDKSKARRLLGEPGLHWRESLRRMLCQLAETL